MHPWVDLLVLFDVTIPRRERRVSMQSMRLALFRYGLAGST